MNRTTTITLSLALLAGGCTVGPEYKAPQTATPAEWGASSGIATGEGVASRPKFGGDPIVEWWKSFNDPTLDSLIARAVESNLDLKVATSRVREARAMRGAAKADYYPSVDARAQATRSRGSETISRFGGFNTEDIVLYSAGLDASWEIDIFGAVQRGVEAADADLQAAREARHDVLVSLLAEVARNYADVRGLQKRLDVARSSVKVQEDSVAVAEARLQAGISGELEAAQARALLQSRIAVIPLLTTAYYQALHRLGVLLGQEPGALLSELTEPGKIPPPPAEIPVGLPSDLLRRRPDVRRAERELAAATARIGVAEADLYPRFSLNGSFGFESRSLASLFDMDSRSWVIGPSVRWRVFDAGRIRRQIEAAGARQQQSLARYDVTVLEALEEVENRLVAFTQEQARRDSLEKAVEANQRAVDLSNDLYKAGVRDFLNVLVSQRALYDSRDALVQSEQAVTSNLIALYKSLGGGWEGLPEPETGAPAGGGSTSGPETTGANANE